jgi:subtilisin family serine protease
MTTRTRFDRSGGSLALLGGVLVALGSATAAQAGNLQKAPKSVAQLVVDDGIATAVLDSGNWGVARSQVVVRLSERHGGGVAKGLQKAQRAKVDQQQTEVLALAQAVDPAAKVLGRTRMVLNALILEIDGKAVTALSKDSRVLGLDPVVNYRRALEDTVPQIGAAVVQAAGVKGAGVSVAVLDSGIDYTHEAFGGAGTLAAYQAAYGTATDDAKTTTRDGLFPTARVVEGYDFVGETWPSGPLTPDDDPIDCGAGGLVTPGACAGGHGTHVADIIGGLKGVAPEVDLYAVKVCSAVSTSCSGVAILQGLEYVVDPDGDGDTSDAIDVVNMSLGAPYGLNYDNASAIATDNATEIGVLTVASAGNSADKPYVTGTPSAARTALSVAQTEVPSSQLQLIELDSSAVSDLLYGAQFQPWSAPLGATISAPVVYDTTNAGTRLGCSNAAGANPWVGTPLAGKIVLVDRGTCAFSLKITNIKAAGGVAGVIALVDTSLPFSGGFGGGDPSIPGYMIRQVDGNAIKAQLANAANLTLDPTAFQSIAGTMVGSSSRGPASGLMRYQDYTVYGQLIKPEIGAPGASISAIAGSGTDTEAFGGTSGAAPMVAGSAALLLDATDGALSPLEVKARLTNTGEREIFNTPPIWGGALAAIARIGGGEVRVDRAVGSSVAVWHDSNYSGALSFGTVEADQTTTVSRRLTVRNYGDATVSLSISPKFRFANDEATGAVSVQAPATFSVPAGSSRVMTVRLTVDPTKLAPFTANSGPGGANSLPLTAAEYDGYLEFRDPSNPANEVNVPWHVLPRKAANVQGPRTTTVGVPTAYTNSGATTAQVNTYSLLGLSNKMQVSNPGEGMPPIDLKAVGYATFDGTGVCPNNTYILQFAIANHYRLSHSIAPGQVRIYLDVDRDGTPDFQVRSADFTLNNLTDGRSLVWVVNLRTGSAGALFFTDHGLNTSNLVLTTCGSQFADLARPVDQGGPIPVPALGQLIDADFTLYDNYFTGTVRDAISGVVFAPGGERFVASMPDIPAGSSADLEVSATGSTLDTSELGVLLMLDAVRGGAKNGNPDGREAITVRVR